MKVDCEICGGSGKIRLPVKPRVGMTLSPEDASLSIREYACPECGYKVPQEKILIVQAQGMIEAKYVKRDGQKFMDYVKQNLAHQIGAFLFKENQIRFEKLETQDDYGRERYPLRATLGVVSPRVVATFEDRVKEKQLAVANAVMEEAAKRIRGWGKDFEKASPNADSAPIRKGDAIRFMYEVLYRFMKEPK